MTALLMALLVACDDGFSDPTREYGPPVAAEARRYPVSIHVPTTLGVADTHLKDVHGTPIGVSCATCHGPDPDRSWAARDDVPDDFHAPIEVVHGDLSCASCHDPTDKTALHLADGTRLDLTDAMTLCAQCHGVQFRDYQHGSHGGMTGYWDLRRGGRDRNHCVDCHAPHAPAYGQVLPVHPPRDRYLDVDDDSGEAH